MKVLGFTEHGDWKNLKVVELPAPQPGPGEVRVRVRYCALNRLDLFVLKGWKGLALEMPHVGGSDVAGEVDDVGAGVEGWARGDRVVLYPSTSCGRCEYCRRDEVSMCLQHRLFGEHKRGGLAELLVVPSKNLKRVPDGFPLDQAAAASLVMLTAWRMLVTRAQLRAGESVLVVGSGGGVNTAAIQIAKLCGASPIYAVGSTEEKRALARSLGADVTLGTSEPWEKEVFRQTQKRGVDVVVDNVGAATWAQSLRAAARGGRVVTVGGTTGYDPPAMLNQVFWKQLSIVGSTMGNPSEFESVMDLVFAGRLKAIVDKVYSLWEGVEAYRHLAEGRAAGKILVAP